MKTQYRAGLSLAYNDPHLRKYLDSSDSDSGNKASGPYALAVLMMRMETMRRVRMMRASSTEAKAKREVLEQGSTNW